MSSVSSMEGVSSAVTAQEVKNAQKKSKVSGKTIGNPELSEKAAKYYEELKQKYSNMDFILVSKDQKEQAEANAAKYATSNKMVVLIDDEKIEKMAEDKEYRAKYEGIINNAVSGMAQLQSSLATSPANVKTYGIKVNDNGTASFFAVVDKSLAIQKDRIAKKAEQKKEAKKVAAKKAEKKEKEERIDQAKAEKMQSEETADASDTVTVTASSIEELVRKINDQVFASMSDQRQTEAEKQVGQHMDYRL